MTIEPISDRSTTSQEQPSGAGPPPTSAELRTLLQQSLTMWEYIFAELSAAERVEQPAQPAQPDEKNSQS